MSSNGELEPRQGEPAAAYYAFFRVPRLLSEGLLGIRREYG